MSQTHRCPHGEEVRFEKFSHNYEIKHENKGSPHIYWQPQVPPLKEYAQNLKDPPPSGFPTNVHLCIGNVVFFIFFVELLKGTRFLKEILSFKLIFYLSDIFYRTNKKEKPKERRKTFSKALMFERN